MTMLSHYLTKKKLSVNKEDHAEIERILRRLKAIIEDISTNQKIVFSEFVTNPVFSDNEMSITIKLKRYK